MTPQNKNQPATVKKDHWNKRTNKILEDHGDWLLVDISTPKFPDATMAVDADVFEAHDGGRVYADRPANSKYIYGKYNISYNRRYFHRDVVNACDMSIDHINHGNMSFIDNRRSNLRVVTNSQNIMNGSIRTNNTSGITGVVWNKQCKKWQAQIVKNGKHISLGLFDNIDFAIGARQQAEREYFGEYAFKGVSK